jgi:TfoX/Sxy family transcriptional regulator of competence genes
MGGVEERKMMGCLSYLVGRKMFALVVTKGIVITKLDDESKKALLGVHPWKPFDAHRTIKKWAHLELEPEDVPSIISFIRKSYEAAKKEAGV